ncbi:hypothetical protein SAMN05660649_02118 [Desulfotomaculum arcticum]|uniref:Uncharacterized protein n=1 Tax=Desulfotruncus arcticus DSM 17038 TaxID=1121424 RepID=A0A1I2T957_9FIRM|nr:hypothetical protein [Desulfotruncus arcticus]SFG61544.1 hypothetical protein SAMN05660649_02118 [Desulfotomaculum arcticum] [Desulfotruncus arcticus DSM 17038]
MITITVEKFAKMYVENNPGEKFNDIKSNLKAALSRKKAGAVCANCGEPIWAAGSVIVGSDGCFTCITGESDHSGDYEVYE